MREALSCWNRRISGVLGRLLRKLLSMRPTLISPTPKKMTVDGTRTLRQSADPKPAISGRADGSNSRNRSAGSHVQPCPREVHHKRKKRGLGCQRSDLESARIGSIGSRSSVCVLDEAAKTCSIEYGARERVNRCASGKELLCLWASYQTRAATPSCHESVSPWPNCWSSSLSLQ